jgi:hypothetical protein
MKRLRTYWYKTLALIIAGAFTYVQATAVNCSINRLVDVAQAEHHHPFGHDHHHAESDASEHHHKDSGSDHAADCCTDFTSAFFSAFAKVQAGNVAFTCKQPCVEFVLAYRMSSPAYSCFVATKVASEPLYPPPKIPDIRIFISSFQV